MKKPKKEKWKTVASFREPHRLVVDQNNVLVADCYSDSAENYGLPSLKAYKNNAKRIAMLPDIIRALEYLEPTLRCGSPGHSKVNELLVHYNKLR